MSMQIIFLLTHFIINNLVNGVAVLGLLLAAVLLRLVLAHLAHHLAALLAENLVISLLAHLFGDRLALLAVAKGFELLGLSSFLNNALLDWFSVTFLVLDDSGLKELEFLTNLLNPGMAPLLVNSPWNDLAMLLRLHGAHFTLMSLMAFNLHVEKALLILDNLLFLPALAGLDVYTVNILILLRNDIVDHITNLSSLREAPLHIIFFWDLFLFCMLHKITLDVFNSGTLFIRNMLHNSFTVRGDCILTLLYNLSATKDFHVRFTYFLLNNAFNLLALRLMV